jgi:hypothetical protein
MVGDFPSNTNTFANVVLVYALLRFRFRQLQRQSGIKFTLSEEESLMEAETGEDDTEVASTKVREKADAAVGPEGDDDEDQIRLTNLCKRREVLNKAGYDISNPIIALIDKEIEKITSKMSKK